MAEPVWLVQLRPYHFFKEVQKYVSANQKLNAWLRIGRKMNLGTFKKFEGQINSKEYNHLLKLCNAYVNTTLIITKKFK